MKRSSAFRSSGLLLFMAAAIFVAAQAGNRDQMEKSCRQFVQAFYDWYAPVAERASTATVTLALKTKPHAFSPKLRLGLWEDYNAQAKVTGEIVGLDFDPFLNSQDPCQPYVAEKVTLKGDRYFVEVHIACGGKRSAEPAVIPELAYVNGRWVFVNFHYGTSDSPGLLALLKTLRDGRRQPRNRSLPNPAPGDGPAKPIPKRADD